MPNFSSMLCRSMYRPGIALAFSLMLCAGVAQSADSERRAAIKGVGGRACAEYVQSLTDKSPVFYQFGGWMSGYLSAYNQAAPETFDIVSWATADTLAQILAHHCDANPQLGFYQAIEAMIRWLESDRLQEFSELVEVTAGETTLRMYQGAMRLVQETLKSKGYYDGAVDGLYGPRTGTAITAFQKDAQVELTGIPDQNTLVRLLR